ncbi:MAG: hypothetical protein M1820_007779 [Bogoriella megaspora]|nr:MAG: hypothetical protein M1820_007779 [Bogoriella megaspora]
MPTVQKQTDKASGSLVFSRKSANVDLLGLCDEARPFCGQCKKSHRTCPGYRDEFDLIFRNETSATKRRAQKSTSTTRDSESPPKTASGRRSKDKDDSNPGRDGLSPDFIATAYNTFFEKSQIPLAPGLWTSDEVQATAFFFRNFVLLPRQTDATRGFLSVLLPFYNNCSSESAIHRATSAVALSALSKFPDRNYLQNQSAIEYGKAISIVNKAIIDPEQAKSDELLCTILLLGLYETINSNRRSQDAWSAHINGAVALAKLRGTEQFNNPISLNLFRAVRAHMLVNAVQHSTAISDFPAENGWLSDYADETSTAHRLMAITLRLPNIRYRAKRVFSDRNLMAQSESLFQLMTAAVGLDAEYAFWFDDLPKVWQPKAVATLEGMPDDIESSEIWPGSINVFENLIVSNLTNNGRMGRIFCQTVIIGCLARQAERKSELEKDVRYQKATKMARELVDAICASVPFHLGYDIRDRTQRVGQHEAAAEAIGGYFLIWPLFVCGRLECVPKEQKRWIRGRLKYIARMYGVDGTEFLDNHPPNYVSRGINMVDDPTPDRYHGDCRSSEAPFTTTKSGLDDQDTAFNKPPRLGVRLRSDQQLASEVPPILHPFNVPLAQLRVMGARTENYA